MSGPRIAFSIGPVSVAWYGIIIVAGAMIAGYVTQHEAERRGQDADHVWNAFLLCVVLGLIGARLYHVISSLDYYRQYPLQIFNLRAGGLGIYGALAGGILALWLYTRRAKLDFFFWADMAVPGLLLAQAIGRWGNFVNQELYGKPTDLPWGIYIDPAHRLPQYAEYERFHPTFFYESFWNLLGFSLFMYLSRRYEQQLKRGDMLLMYGVYYPLGRFFVEFQRPDAWMMGPLATAQWISLAAVLICGLLLWWRHRPRPKPILPSRSACDPGPEQE